MIFLLLRFSAFLVTFIVGMLEEDGVGGMMEEDGVSMLLSFLEFSLDLGFLSM